jgi:hypothetical protein
MNVIKVLSRFIKDYIFQMIVLNILILSPLGSYDPSIKEFLPSHFHQLKQNDFPLFLRSLCDEWTYIGFITFPILASNFYWLRMNTFRSKKEDYIATKMVVLLLSSTIMSFPYQNILGSGSNFALPMFITSTFYFFWDYFRLKKQNNG